MITQAELTAPIECNCGKCGGPAAIYPWPPPHGCCGCETCTAPQILAAVRAMTAKLQSGEIKLGVKPHA